jgi:hypothetical protein
MEKSDVACFAQQCGAKPKPSLVIPRYQRRQRWVSARVNRAVQRVVCQFGSESLNNWLSCTIEEMAASRCPRMRAIDNSAENVGVAGTLQNFDPSTLLGTWYKTDGLNQTTICLIVNPIHFRVVVVMIVIVLLVSVAIRIRRTRTRNWTWVFSVCDPGIRWLLE